MLHLPCDLVGPTMGVHGSRHDGSIESASD
jgi:hypothetical protein